MQDHEIQHALLRIRDADFQPADITHVIVKELKDNLRKLEGTEVYVTYESWHGRSWAIWKRFDQIMIQRVSHGAAGYELVP